MDASAGGRRDGYEVMVVVEMAVAVEVALGDSGDTGPTNVPSSHVNLPLSPSPKRSVRSLS